MWDIIVGVKISTRLFGQLGDIEYEYTIEANSFGLNGPISSELSWTQSIIKFSNIEANSTDPIWHLEYDVIIWDNAAWSIFVSWLSSLFDYL